MTPSLEAMSSVQPRVHFEVDSMLDEPEQESSAQILRGPEWGLGATIHNHTADFNGLVADFPLVHLSFLLIK